MHIHRLKLGTGLAAGILLLGTGSAVPQVPGPFTLAQATAGHAAYLENCASCHSRTLQGGGEAPRLVGNAFISSWGQRGANEFYGVIKASMPLGNGNSLTPETYQQIVAFLFQANGATPGAVAFNGESQAKIASFAAAIVDSAKPFAVVGDTGEVIGEISPRAVINLLSGKDRGAGA